MRRFYEATAADLPQLTALWQTAFGDEISVIQAFWKQCFGKIRVFCLSEEKKLCAMACALPLSYVDEDGEVHSCAYLYAVATEPAFRGQGCCRALLAQAERSLQRDGLKLCCLVPGEASLFAFYQKLGYTIAFTCHRQSIPAKKAEGIRLRRIDASAYENLRQMQLYGQFISYPEFLLELQQQAGLASGAGLYRIESNELVCVAACEKQGERLLIREMLPADESLAAHLAHSLGCKEVMLQSPGDALPYGMAKALSDIPLPQNSYLGLAFG